jgi:peptidoglycan/xylan/chitin deacetylase (PgdA/CDA1 family)
MIANVKGAILRAARWSGVMNAVADSSWRRERLLILCYHWLSYRDEHQADPTYITPAFFRRRLERLRDGGYNVLPLAEALDRVESGTLPPRSVAITFDDGTRDFAELAVPLLREFGMPATVYVTTYYCEHLIPVFDIALRYLLWKTRADHRVAEQVLGDGTQVPAGSDRDAIFGAIYEHARRNNHSADDKQATLRRVAELGRVDFNDFLASGMFQQMTPAQIRDLPRDRIDVQLHTHRHRTPRSREAFLREIRDNRECLRDYLGDVRLEHFCYPSGDYWGEFIGWLREEGVTSATTCVPGFATARAARLLLPRFLDSGGISDLLFDAWTSGVAGFLPRRREHRADPGRLTPSPVAAR